MLKKCQQCKSHFDDDGRFCSEECEQKYLQSYWKGASNGFLGISFLGSAFFFFQAEKGLWWAFLGLIVIIVLGHKGLKKSWTNSSGVLNFVLGLLCAYGVFFLCLKEFVLNK